LRDLIGSYVAVFYPVAEPAITSIVISFFLTGAKSGKS
jgi:hypothetical protein